MNPALLRLAALVSIFCATSALASSDDALQPIVITATRVPEPINDVLTSVTVISRAEIEARQATSLQDLLRGEAGIEFSNEGGPGKVTSMFMRGANSDQVLFLVDGISLGSATTGSTAIQYLPVDQIDHIEIVRGPLSSLYGSEAVGGVIQIFTRGSGATDSGELHPQISFGAGTYDTRQVSGALTQNTHDYWFGISGSYLSSVGYDSCLGQPFGLPNPGGCYVLQPESDTDGYRNASFSLRGGLHTSDTTDLEAVLMRARGATEFAGEFSNREDFVEETKSLTGHWSPSSQLRLTARIGQSQDDERDEENLVYAGTFNTTRLNGTLQGDYTIGPHQVATVGVDYLEDEVDSDSLYALTSRRDTGIFGQFDSDIDREHLALSFRHDNNQQFGGKTTGSAAWGYRFGNQMRFLASYGTAFKAPTFNDLYYPGYSNPDLKPETSRSVELGLDQKTSFGRWSLRAFETRIEDLITLNVDYVPANIDRALIRGAEFDIRGQIDRWIWGLTGTWLDPRDRSGGLNNGNLLTRRTEDTGRIEFGYAWTKFTLSARYQLEGYRFDDAANTVRLGGFATVDLLATWHITKGLSLQAKVANLSDHPYQTAEYYPQPGRNYWLTLRYQQ